MTSKERWKKTLSGQIPDRIVQIDTAFWPETMKRWHKEGLPENITSEGSHWNRVALWEHFEFDPILLQGYFDTSMRFEHIVFEETDEYVIDQNYNGVKSKWWKKHYATPAQLDFTIKTYNDWKKHKTRLDVGKDRLDPDSIKLHEEVKSKYDHFSIASPVGPVWFVLTTLGFENALIKMAAEPEFIIDMVETYTDFTLGMMEHSIEATGGFDALWFFSDLCYKNGMLFSPAMYRELFMPYHKKVKQFCDDNRMFLILHCDGNVTDFVPLLIETGFDAIQPLEVRAGNDVRELKKKHGTDITFFGNINADVLAKGSKKEIEEEVVGKIEVAKKGGGYIYHVDHSVNPGISFENYLFARNLVKEHGNY